MRLSGRPSLQRLCGGRMESEQGHNARDAGTYGLRLASWVAEKPPLFPTHLPNRLEQSADYLPGTAAAPMVKAARGRLLHRPQGVLQHPGRRRCGSRQQVAVIRPAIADGGRTAKTWTHARSFAALPRPRRLVVDVDFHHFVAAPARATPPSTASCIAASPRRESRPRSHSPTIG